jgi:hypothetical protein
MKHKTKKGHKPRNFTIKKRIHHSKSRRVQHGGALHVELGQDRRPIDGNHYKIIQTQTYENGSPEFIYYGRANAIYPALSQICRESERCQDPEPSYVADGKGTLMKFAQDGSFTLYEGRFVNQTKTGRGKMSYFAAIPLISDQFLQFRTMDDLTGITPDQLAELTIELSQHTPYRVDEGNWENDAMSGLGKLTFANGAFYKGHFENGFMSGSGTLRRTDGSVYKGKFSNDDMSGFGKMTYANGDVYVGHWQNNMKSGRGQMRYNNGHVFFGTWYNDHPAATVFGRVINEAYPTPVIFTAVDQSNALSGFQSSANIFGRRD